MSTFNKKAFGERLKKIRKQKGLTQEILANSLNVNPATISRFESGRLLPDIEQISIICDELDIFVSDLLYSNTKIVNKENSKNVFKTKILYLYYKGIYPTSKKTAKLKFKIEIIERTENIEINFLDYRTNKIYMTGYMLADNNIAIMVFENYKADSPRLEVTKITVNISNNFNGLMLGSLSATNGNYVPNERKCIISKKDLEFSDQMLDRLKVTREELEDIEKQDAWYININNKADYEE